MQLVPLSGPQSFGGDEYFRWVLFFRVSQPIHHCNYRYPGGWVLHIRTVWSLQSSASNYKNDEFKYVVISFVVMQVRLKCETWLHGYKICQVPGTCRPFCCVGALAAQAGWFLCTGSLRSSNIARDRGQVALTVTSPIYYTIIPDKFSEGTVVRINTSFSQNPDSYYLPFWKVCLNRTLSWLCWFHGCYHCRSSPTESCVLGTLRQRV